MRKKILLFIVSMLLFTGLTGQPEKNRVVIVIRTHMGDIHARLDLKRAPVTSRNFLRYIDEGLFSGTCFYRVVRTDNQPSDSVKIEVIQGGRYKDEGAGFEPIVHETTALTGILHRNGTVSMARSKPGSATSEFFICVGDQPELDFGGKRNRDGQGFAAFGKVIKGMDVVRRIHSVESTGQYLETPVPVYEIVRSK